MPLGRDTLRTLLIDNHDSYTYNLFQLLAEVNGREPEVAANDDPVLAALWLEGFDNIVVSPGPGRPQVRRDLGHVPLVLEAATVPVLGVCLGHQAIGHLAGATVAAAPRPRHGHLTAVRHDGDPLFAGIPETFTAVRYHSLCVCEPLPPDLVATAWSEDDVVMALRHRSEPRWGVQFHPESIATEHGRRLLANFRDFSDRERYLGGSGSGSAGGAGFGIGSGAAARDRVRRHAVPALPIGPARRGRTPHGKLELEVATLDAAVDAEAAYLELFAASDNSFWLDSSRVEPGLSRFSFLGDASGPLSETLICREAGGPVVVRSGGGIRVDSGGMFDLLAQRLAERQIADPGLPFGFTGGYVGYFGYEMKQECGAPKRYQARTPDSAWIFADRLIAVDHEAGRTYALAAFDGAVVDHAAARDWVDQTIEKLAALEPVADPQTEGAAAVTGSELESRMTGDRFAYEAAIGECLRQLQRGESYEICLTGQLRMPFTEDDVEFYRRLRRANPAPYSALLRIGPVSVFSSSPERFLRIDSERRVESKPIKGTARRDPDPARDAELAAALATDAKTRAENLMIVDLLRNDLGRVCEIGSVKVDRYMAVESYETVHQLVSTITGRLSPDVGAVDCVRVCFPGGSMTGAPKLRTMEIIDRLETEARGVYSGALGFLGLSGEADLSIVIRTAVRFEDELGVGAGGAIVLDSDPADEYEEMLLKAGASLRSVLLPDAVTAAGLGGQA